MRYSIIMPIYCTDKYLARSIESIIQQEFKDYELILVNDCSTDNSIEICKQYAAKYENIKLIDKPINEGVKLAVIDGIKIAKGDYICFIDSDDLWQVNCLAKIENKLVEQDYDMLVFSYNIVDEKNNIIGEYTFENAVYQKSKDMTNCIELILPSNDCQFVTPARWNKVFKSDLLKNVVNSNLSEFPLKKAEDLEMVVNALFLANTVCLISDKLYDYTIRQGSITNCDNNYNNDIIFMLENLETKVAGMDECIYNRYCKFSAYTIIDEVKNYLSRNNNVFAKQLLKSKLAKKVIKKTMYHANSIRESIYLSAYYMHNIWLIRFMEKLLKKKGDN